MEQYPDRGVSKVTEDGRLYRCRKCGFVCDKEKVISAKKYENVGESIEYLTDTVENKVYPNVVKGCPFCGSTRSR